LKVFSDPKISLEQYSTDSEIAAEILWFAALKGDIEAKQVGDMGCGTGILGIGCLLLNARKAYFVDKDSQAINTLKENIFKLGLKRRSIIINKDISDFNERVDTIVQNPPFGVKKEHADKMFLEKAFKIADVIYSFHKIESSRFIESICRDNNFRVSHFFQFEFPLKHCYFFHARKVQHIKVGCWRLENIHKTID
ncbi:methyltransferase, partial [Candidatus Woesearchaeota archaeon]|nr:methyltransferase [Candidatus Woesearchaeota archaeon]